MVLDEPNSNLDAEGERALANAIHAVRRRYGIVVMITHSSQAIESADIVALMREGHFAEFGPKDEVARKLAPAGSSGADAYPRGSTARP